MLAKRLLNEPNETAMSLVGKRELTNPPLTVNVFNVTEPVVVIPPELMLMAPVPVMVSPLLTEMVMAPLLMVPEVAMEPDPILMLPVPDKVRPLLLEMVMGPEFKELVTIRDDKVPEALVAENVAPVSVNTAVVMEFWSI